MTSVNGALSAYQQANSYSSSSSAATARAGGAASSAKEQDNPVKEQTGPKVETKGWSPIDPGSSLIPRKTEYGYTIGDVQLSDKAKAYYDTLKSKFHNMEFIAVSKDMKAQVQQNASAYGNADKMVVLIDDEKLERMAEDEEYRKKRKILCSCGKGHRYAKEAYREAGGGKERAESRGREEGKEERAGRTSRRDKGKEGRSRRGKSRRSRRR